MRFAMKTVMLCCLGMGAVCAFAQAWPEPRNVVQLSATAEQELPQDWLVLVLRTSREGSDAQALQAQLKRALEEALALARPAVEPGALALRTGAFSLTPRRNREGRMDGWQGTAELVLEGQDVARISALAARVSSMNVASVNFSLSPTQQAAAEARVQALAIERFKARAADIAQAFGFAAYALREVNVSSSVPVPRPRMMALAASRSEADASMPLEAGKGVVQVTVNGSVQLK